MPLNLLDCQFSKNLQEGKDEHKGKRDRISIYFKAQTPVYIVTNNDDWVGGYIYEEPTNEFYFHVLDWKKNEAVKVHYIDFEPFRLKEWKGDLSKLPLPPYMLGGFQ